MKEYLIKCNSCGSKTKTNKKPKRDTRMVYYKTMYPLMELENIKRDKKVRGFLFKTVERTITADEYLYKNHIIEKFKFKELKCPICGNIIHSEQEKIEEHNDVEKIYKGKRFFSSEDYLIRYSDSLPFGVYGVPYREIDKEEYEELKEKMYYNYPTSYS